MLDEKNKKKKISIIFAILREEILGFKDLDHILPFFFYFLGESKSLDFKARLIIFENKSHYVQNNDPRIKFINNLKNVELEFLYKDNLLVKIKKLFELKNNFKWINTYNNLINKIYSNILKIRQKKINLNNRLGESFINSEFPIIITLHSNKIAQKIVSRIKKINTKAKWIVLPHGSIITDNKMVLESDLEKNEIVNENKIYKEIDYFFCTSKRDFENAVLKGLERQKGSVIGSPRFCDEWIKIKNELNLDGKDVESKNTYKLKVLFLIPKKHINIFREELVRTIDFLSSYQEFEIILLNYNLNFPKLPKQLLARKNLKNYLISKEYSTSKLIDWADVVFHVGTGIIFESFIKKITVLPRYLTSNTLISDKYNAGYNLNNRDELRDFCNQALNSIDDLKKYEEKCEKNNQKYIDEFVYANTNSVSQNINNELSKAIDKLYSLDKN